MTLKDILEDCYGIDFETLTFNTQKGVDTCSVEEIKKSIEQNELVLEDSLTGKRLEIDDFDGFDIFDYDKESVIYYKK